MSISKRKLFSEIYKEQEKILRTIDEPIRVRDLDISYIGKRSEFNFNIVAEQKGVFYKCLCPVCEKWVNEWENWFECKEGKGELSARCKCGNITQKGDLICRKI